MTSAFGMQMPGRTFSGNGIGGADYKYSFNGKEDDKSSGWFTQDYGFRNYDYRLGRFFSQDPLFRIYPELTPYQFASNTPIQAIDRDGLEAFFVGGTWQGKINAWSLKSRQKIASILGNKTQYHLKWSGNNNRMARKIDARVLAGEIYKVWTENGRTENINLVGHSHGGNVMIEVANILSEVYGVTPEIILTVNTPNIKAHQLSKDIKSKHIQIYNPSDITQSLGGNAVVIPDFDEEEDANGGIIRSKYQVGEKMGTGEIGPAESTFDDATNIKYDHQTDASDGDWGNHMGNWSENVDVWAPLLDYTLRMLDFTAKTGNCQQKPFYGTGGGYGNVQATSTPRTTATPRYK